MVCGYGYYTSCCSNAVCHYQGVTRRRSSLKLVRDPHSTLLCVHFVSCSRDLFASKLPQVKCHHGCLLQSNHTRPRRNSSRFPCSTNSSGSYQSETFESYPLELVASWKGVLPSVFQVLTNSSGQSSAPGSVSSTVTPKTITTTSSTIIGSKPSVGTFVRPLAHSQA